MRAFFRGARLSEPQQCVAPRRAWHPLKLDRCCGSESRAPQQCWVAGFHGLDYKGQSGPHVRFTDMIDGILEMLFSVVLHALFKVALVVLVLLAATPVILLLAAVWRGDYVDVVLEMYGLVYDFVAEI